MTPNVPDNGLDQMEQAQVALRDGLERARKLVRQAKLAMRERDSVRPEPPTTNW
jgi:hypothetical protein